MSIESAFQSIAAALATGKAGIPVAVHVVLQWDLAADQLDRQVLAVVATWLDDQPVADHGFRSDAADHGCRLVRYNSGKTALLAIGQCEPSQRFVKILVVCNHGIVSWESDNGMRIDQSSPIAISKRKVVRAPIEPPYGVLLVAGDHTHQPNYASALKADPRCRLVGLTDSADVPTRRQKLNSRLAETLGIPLLPDLDEAIARDDVDIVSICAEPYRRGPLVAKAAAAGKHLYLDKPFTATVEHAAEVLAAARKTGVVSSMFSFLQFDAFRHMRQVIASGVLGRLISVHCDLFFAKGEAGGAQLGRPRRESAKPERYELADAKRELSNVGVYCLTNLIAILQQRIVKVAASTGNFFFAEHQGHDMEDFGQMLLETDDGLLCTVSAGRTGWHSCPSFGLNRVWIVGTEGAVTIDGDRPRAEIWSDAAPWSPPPRNPEDPMGMWMQLGEDPFRPDPKYAWITKSPAIADADVKHFLDAIQFGYDCDVPVEIAAQTTEVLLAAYGSAASNQVVTPSPADG